MLEIDIIKDKTYDDNTLEKIQKIEFIQNIIEFNIYGRIRKLLENYDRNITFPGMGYNGNDRHYPALYKQNPILEMDLFNQTITLPEYIILEPKLRYECMEKLIELLAQKIKEKPELVKTSRPYRNYFYQMTLGCIIDQLKELKTRSNILESNLSTRNKYNWELYEKIKEEYGPFEYTYKLDHSDEEIKIDAKGNLVSLITVKETPIITFQKKIIYH